MSTPPNLPNLFPALLYNDAPAALDWLERVFGFERLMVAPGADGTIAHAEMSFGPGIVMVSTAKPERKWVSPRDLAGLHQTLYVRVDDVDAHYARAKAAGAEIAWELKDTDYGSREYSAHDLEGHFWSFGTYQPSRPPA
jgi:uncharacterized glyoxalase superfamily protein PhnB